MRKGDIFWAKNKDENPHPLIFLDWIDDISFKACILSTKSAYSNILMLESHFCKRDQNGKPYSIQFSNTHLIPNVSFIKLTSWLKSDIEQGKLTNEGVEFVERHITEKPILWPAPIWEFESDTENDG